MAKMAFREGNQVLWYGFRPAHNGEQVVAHNTASNETKIIYTVPAGKTLFLTSVLIDGYSNAGVSTQSLLVRNAADVVTSTLFRNLSSIERYFINSHNFNPPFEIAALYDICVVSNTVTSRISAFLHGWEE